MMQSQPLAVDRILGLAGAAPLAAASSP